MNRAQIGVFLWLFGCGADADLSPLPATQPLNAREAARPNTLEGGVVLDVSPHGRLVGIPHEAPPNADPERIVTLRVDPPTLAPDLDGAVVLDARFVELDGEVSVVVIDTAHALRHYRANQATTLDESAYGPLGVLGSEVVYTIGDPPFLEVARADMRTGQREQVTRNLAPTWNPALGPDGEIYVVSGVTGAPRLLRLDGRDSTQIQTERFPSSVHAPVVRDNVLVFEDESGAEVRLTLPARGAAQ